MPIDRYQAEAAAQGILGNWDRRTHWWQPQWRTYQPEKWSFYQGSCLINSSPFPSIHACPTNHYDTLFDTLSDAESMTLPLTHSLTHSTRSLPTRWRCLQTKRREDHHVHTRHQARTSMSWPDKLHSAYKKILPSAFLVLQLVTNRRLISVPWRTSQYLEGPTSTWKDPEKMDNATLWSVA